MVRVATLHVDLILDPHKGPKGNVELHCVNVSPCNVPLRILDLRSHDVGIANVQSSTDNILVPKRPQKRTIKFRRHCHEQIGQWDGVSRGRAILQCEVAAANDHATTNAQVVVV